MSVRVSVIVGGQDRIAQCRELNSKPHVVIATPGRLHDILGSQQDFTLKNIKYLVLDEADRWAISLLGWFSRYIASLNDDVSTEPFLFIGTQCQDIKFISLHFNES